MVSFLFYRRLSRDFYLSEIHHHSDLKTIGDHWEFGRERFGENLHQVLCYLNEIGCGALGSYERKSNKLVSWLISDVDGHGMVGHCLKPYRQLGLQAWTLLEAIEREMFVPFNGQAVGYVGISNKNSYEKSLQLGAEVCEKPCVNFIVKPCKRKSKL